MTTANLTIQDNDTVVQYTSTGGTVFAGTFPILDEDEVKVSVDQVLQVLGTDYTISGVGDENGFTVTFLSATTTGEQISIWQDMPMERLTGFATGAAVLTGQALNTEFARQLRHDQQLRRDIRRSLRIPADDPDSGQNMEIPALDTRKGMYLAFDATSGEPIAASGTGTDAALRADLAAGGAALVDSTAVTYLRTLAEEAVAVFPVFPKFAPGDVRRFAVLDGVTDDTTALTNWAKVPGYHFWPVTAVAKITAAIPLMSSSTFEFCDGAEITTATTNISFLTATSKTNIRIYGGLFRQTAAGASAYVAGVKLTSCTNCKVISGEFIGMQWAGVMLNNSSRCKVQNNYFHDFLGSVNDCNDITLYEASDYNEISGNDCYGAKWHGILAQDPYTGLIPKKNKIHHNNIGAHTAYGIAVYVPAIGNSYNQVTNNDIQDISGSADTTLFGSGIYVVGYGCGGTLVSGNNVRNCCTATTAVTNGPAGISIAGLYSSGVPVVVSNNIVEGMTKYWGILAVTNVGIEVILSNNTVNHPTGNTTGEPIRIEASTNTSVIGNRVKCSTASGRRCIAIYANSVTMYDIDVSLNACVGGGDRQIEFLTAGGGVFNNVTIHGNKCRAAASGVISMYLTGVQNASVCGNVLAATSAHALYISGCINTRISGGNVLETTGTVALGTTGTCTNSFADRSNYYDGFVENTGAGFLYEAFGTAAPSSGSSYGRVGDRVVNSAPSAGNPKSWVCTTASNPGTWTSEGNL